MLMKAIEKNAPQLEVLKLNANEIGPKAAELVVKTCYILLFFIFDLISFIYTKDLITLQKKENSNENYLKKNFHSMPYRSSCCADLQ